jgi:hypothetical protein
VTGGLAPLSGDGLRGGIVVVGGAPALVGTARRLLARLEHRWSRFRPDSDISA